MESETSCRSTAVSEDEVGRCLSEDSDRGDDDCCCSCSNCPPHIFTSILLGLLACVLVSGGVFLAFHKWDHTWLLVSAVGVILMIIGTALHCCSSSKNDRKKHRCKGGCGNGSGRNSKPDPLSNGGGGMLAEQLLPLSNARSVSQLSLNMVPGYFPPIVYPAGSPYGLEQHSAVVQNISRLVQHQQQLHLQAPSTTAAAAANGDGARSFILLSLPADANPANIQNLVNAVCQLDANNQPENANQTNQETETPISVPSQSSTTPQHTEGNGVILLSTPVPTVDLNYACSASSTTPPTNAVSTTVATGCSAQPPALKNAEVQTCSNWPSPAASELKIPALSRSCASQSDGGCSSTAVAAENVPNDVNFHRAGSTDGNSQRTNSNEVCLIDIGDSTPQSTSSAQTESGNMICDTEQLSVVQINIPPAVTNGLQDVDLMDITSDPPALIELPPPASVNTTMHSICNGSSSPAEDGVHVDEEIGCSVQNSGGGGCSNENSGPGTETNDPEQQIVTSVDPPPCGAAVQSSNLEDAPGSSSDFDEEDGDLMDRSSPPPSYEDVTQEGQTPALGAIGLAYGTL